MVRWLVSRRSASTPTFLPSTVCTATVPVNSYEYLLKIVLFWASRGRSERLSATKRGLDF
jgi:hypothetical protein